MKQKWMLCQDCLAVLPWDDSDDPACSCGGDLCGCDFCQVDIDKTKMGDKAILRRREHRAINDQLDIEDEI